MNAIDIVWMQLQSEIQTLTRRVTNLEQRSEITGETFSFPMSTLAGAPLAADGMNAFAVRFITDGRKSGETAGNGTGIPAYYNPATNNWRRFYDDAAVTI